MSGSSEYLAENDTSNIGSQEFSPVGTSEWETILGGWDTYAPKSEFFFIRVDASTRVEKEGVIYLIEAKSTEGTIRQLYDYAIGLKLIASRKVPTGIESLLDNLQQEYWIRIPDVVDVSNYLLRYSDMRAILIRVCELTRETMGLYPELSLEVFHDPEEQDEYLTLYVRERYYSDEIMSKIDYVLMSYQYLLSDINGWILVTTDFQPPNQI